MVLTDKRVVVVGGTSGIGLATARQAADAGATVLVASRSRSNVDAALAELPDGVAGEAVDAADPFALQQFLQDAGPLDHLVFTAGGPLTMATVPELDLAVAREFLDVRLFGALAAVRAAVPLLRDGGSIVLSTGLAGRRPAPGLSVVAALCGAMESLTKALAVELAPRLRVNVVCPGVIRSPLWASLPEEVRNGLYADDAAANPLGRSGEPEDAARAYLYAMTQEFLTGATLTVDGGAELV